MLDKPIVSSQPQVKIVCQPRPGTAHSSGQSFVLELRDLPEIEIVGYTGPAVVVVSCVDHHRDRPRVHPYNMVGSPHCRQGVCVLKVKSCASSIKFHHLGIQSVEKAGIRQFLRQRKQIRVDPFRQGFEHVEDMESIDLTAVRLCFQVFLENPHVPGKFTEILKPVCSKVINTETEILKIVDISDIFTPVDGGKKLIILCEKITHDDIAVRFYDGDLDCPWQAVVKPTYVHEEYALVLYTPPYNCGHDGGGAVVEIVRKVFVTLVRPSDGMSSEPVDMFYVPLCHHVQVPINSVCSNVS